MKDDELAAWARAQGDAFRAFMRGERASSRPDPDVEEDRRRELAQQDRDRRQVTLEVLQEREREARDQDDAAIEEGAP